MKNILWTLLGTLLVTMIFGTDVLAQSGKIVYVDSYRIRQEWKEFLEAQSQFDKELDEWEQEARQLENELDSLKRDLQDKSLLLSEEARTKREEVIGTKEAALLARNQGWDVVMWRLDMPSFAFYYGDITPLREPEPGEVVFTRVTRLGRLDKPTEVLFQKGGIVLARALEGGEGGR